MMLRTIQIFNNNQCWNISTDGKYVDQRLTNYFESTTKLILMQERESNLKCLFRNIFKLLPGFKYNLLHLSYKQPNWEINQQWQLEFVLYQG